MVTPVIWPQIFDFGGSVNRWANRHTGAIETCHTEGRKIHSFDIEPATNWPDILRRIWALFLMLKAPLPRYLFQVARDSGSHVEN